MTMPRPLNFHRTFASRALSLPTASPQSFQNALDSRDRFFGQPGCVVCGTGKALQRFRIIRRSELWAWDELKKQNWIPSQFVRKPEHEVRNSLILCRVHSVGFDTYSFFIRYMPEIQRFVFINFSGSPNNKLYHGKAIALDINDHRAPFPSLFITHEMRTRGFNPFEVRPMIPSTIPWQDWLILRGVLKNSDSGLFRRDGPAPPIQKLKSLAKPPADVRNLKEPTQSLMGKVLKATQETLSWKACVGKI